MATRVNVKDLRTKLGLNREDFSQKAGCSPRTVRRWENGEADPSQMATRHLEALMQEPPIGGPRRRSHGEKDDDDVRLS